MNNDYIWIVKWNYIHADRPFGVFVYIDGKTHNHDNFKTLDEAERWADWFKLPIVRDVSVIHNK